MLTAFLLKQLVAVYSGKIYAVRIQASCCANAQLQAAIYWMMKLAFMTFCMCFADADVPMHPLCCWPVPRTAWIHCAWLLIFDVGELADRQPCYV